VDDVKRVAGKTRVPSVGLDDLDPAQPSLRDEIGGHRDMRRGAVKANNATARRDPVAQHLDDAARAAAEIDRAVPGPQTSPIEHRFALGRQLIRLALQPLALATATAKAVYVVRIEIRMA
jgi:hypothetical protein